ncbi:CHAT domain-containing protein [Tardiphaga sp. 20_F10_N6_6]|uniref:CHAT domain-containing protein n=1 Tax=Tardiphaga sp. 20_F10_N6_6 TaxID=3240788 RepID=UPI003F88ED93
MKFDPRIYFMIVVPDGDPHEATPLQGFALSLCNMSWAIRAAAVLPTDIFEWSDDGREIMLARRMSGTSPINWYGQSPRAIRSMPHPVWAPFTVIVLPPSEKIDDYEEWLKSCPIRPVMVAKSGGDLDEIGLAALREKFLAQCDALQAHLEPGAIEEAKAAIRSWKPLPDKRLEYQVGGHNSILPNLVALTVAGYEDMVAGRFDKIGDEIDPYVEQIVKTTNSVFAERRAVGKRDVQRIYRRPPDLNLFAPAIYPKFFDIPAPPFLTAEEKRKYLNTRQLLKNQTGYGFTVRTDAQKDALVGHILRDDDGKIEASPNTIMALRGAEWMLNTDLMAALCSSDLSACVRLPNEINRTLGTVRSFAEHYRSGQATSRKRLLAFRAVQDRISASVPREFHELIRQSESGIRVVSDAHLEWIDLDGLPLFLRKDCTRIPVTPGNLFVDQLAARPIVHLTSESFKEILVISALSPDDPIRRLFRLAFETFEPRWRGKLSVKFVDVASESELVDAFNAYSGPMVIFDGHGSHSQDEPAMLHLGDTNLDVWRLRGKIENMPPIVVLSACDTHAADRNHATTANGFIQLGARTVLSSVFPLLAQDAALFTARLVYRVAEYIPAALKSYDQAITWTEIISGMLRMQLLTDFLRLLESKGLIDDAAYREIHLEGNMAINGRVDDPFAHLIDNLEGRGLARSDMNRYLELAVANSSVISYLQIGRPETIIIDSADRFGNQLKEMQDASELEA